MLDKEIVQPKMIVSTLSLIVFAKKACCAVQEAILNLLRNMELAVLKKEIGCLLKIINWKVLTSVTIQTTLNLIKLNTLTNNLLKLQ
jgi:hypothetical protein